jgi:hypothetical protein
MIKLGVARWLGPKETVAGAKLYCGIGRFGSRRQLRELNGYAIRLVEILGKALI